MISCYYYNKENGNCNRSFVDSAAIFGVYSTFIYFNEKCPFAEKDEQDKCSGAD